MATIYSMPAARPATVTTVTTTVAVAHLTPAQQALITADLMGYADAWAKKYAGKGVDLEDLQASAYLGLCEAALKFNPTKGASFKTFATNYIKKAIFEAIATWQNPMRVPKSLRQEVNMLSLDVEIARCEKQHRESENEDAMEAYNNDSEPDALVDYEEIRKREVHEKVVFLLSYLNEKERQVVDLYYGLTGDELETEEIAKRLEVKPERVRQLYRSAMAKLKIAGAAMKE